jgi:hypothetical protein
MKIIFLESKKWSILEQKGLKRKEVEKIVKKAAKDAAKLLPSLSPHLNLVVFPTKPEWVIKETGTGGVTYSEEYVELSFDCDLSLGPNKIKKELRAIVFHELTHASSHFCSGEEYAPNPLFALKEEGLASVFERDNSGVTPLWSSYEDNAVMIEWYKEVKALPIDSKSEDFLFDHPDGRRWIIYKTGTWMIDKMLGSKYEFKDLVCMTHKSLIKEFEKLLKTNSSQH